MSPTPYRLEGTHLHGLVLRPLDVHRDERGDFTEIFKTHWPGTIDTKQWSLVRSAPNVLRGPHLHLAHDEMFLLLQGTAFVGLRDLRPGSPTRNRSCLIELHGHAPVLVLFRRGFVHGWYFGEESMHLQSVTQCYEEYHPEDNLGCRWDDPELEIAWPCTDPILSERAASFPSLRELVERAFAAATR